MVFRLGSWLWMHHSSSKQEDTLWSQSRLVAIQYTETLVHDLWMLFLLTRPRLVNISFIYVLFRQTVSTQQSQQKQCFRAKWRSYNRSSSSQQSKWRLSHLSVTMPVSLVATVPLRSPRLLLLLRNFTSFHSPMSCWDLFQSCCSSDFAFSLATF